MCFVASEQNTHTSTDELLETGKENSCTCRKTKKAEHNYLRMDFLRILRLALLQKGNKTMIKCFQDSTSCVCPSSRTVSHSPFRHRSIQGKNPFTTPNNKLLVQSPTPFLAALPLSSLCLKRSQLSLQAIKQRPLKMTSCPAGFVKYLIAHTIIICIMQKAFTWRTERTKQEYDKSSYSNYAHQHRKVASRTYPLPTSSVHSYCCNPPSNTKQSPPRRHYSSHFSAFLQGSRYRHGCLMLEQPTWGL